MTWTALDIAFKLYHHLKSLTLSTAGGLYINQRPAQSQAEDMVINSGTLSGDTLQTGQLGLNVYVPNLTITLNGTQDQSQPDTQRLSQLEQELRQGCAEIWGSSWNFEMLTCQVKPDTDRQHFLEITFAFRGIYSEA